MASANAIILAGYVEDRTGTQKLVEYTNELGSATTINTISLYSCCDDAMSDFRVHAGAEPDLDNHLHVAKLISGTLYYLMFYKGRDSSLLQKFEKKFYAGLKDIAKKFYPKAISNSKLKQSVQSANSIPDMDRTLAVFGAGTSRSSYIPSETDS